MPNRDDFRPTASWANLRLRAGLLRRLREFFDDRGFLEVETPVLSADTVIDRHLEPFLVAIADASGEADRARRYWLQTSPEFGMKRLLAAGGEAIYQIGRAFREGEQGRLHNPEFTIAEWYRSGDDMARGMRFLSDVAECLLERGPADTISYREAFQRHAGFDPHTADPADVVSAARSEGVAVPESLRADDRDGWLDLMFVELARPHLGVERPMIVYDYPASQAALARVRPEDPPVAERFELFVSGIELANGYHELLDPAVLSERNARINRARMADGKPGLPEESRLLRAMQSGLPASTGVALGFDRVAMLAAGASCLEEVMAFPFDRA
jgi:lysyl-tRNA synthetase class 2